MKVLTMCTAHLPEDRTLQGDYARALFTQGEFRLAAQAAEKAFRMDAPEVGPLQVLADVMRIERLPGAKMNYESILVLDPGNRHAREELLAIDREMRNSAEQKL
ncbi:MAG: hypothetical protein CME21_02320 [Gemmatimonadetes bacterium]|nr:hypothetical protein [Gemmatimonadota bacterium]